MRTSSSTSLSVKADLGFTCLCALRRSTVRFVGLLARDIELADNATDAFSALLRFSLASALSTETPGVSEGGTVS
jgi:hypothetical protein